MKLKHLILGVALTLFTTIGAWALTCDTNCGTQPCDANSTGSWTNCGGGIPSSADSWTVAAGSILVIDGTALNMGPGILNGTLTFDPDAADRDAQGMRDLTITCDGGFDGLTISTTGRLQMRRRDLINFESTTDNCTLDVQNGGIFDVQGSVVQTYVNGAVVVADSDADPCGGTDGQEYTVPLNDVSAARVGGRVVFQSGLALSRHYEIVTVNAADVVICTDMPDGSSLGQRLTPHATYAGARLHPVTKHSEPNFSDDMANDCNGVSDPWSCCTGVGAGVCVAALPAEGDLVAVVDDAWIIHSTGANGFDISEATGGNSPMPIMWAANVGADGGTGANSRIKMANRALVAIPAMWYNNVHDLGGNGTWQIFGPHQGDFRWNAVHDDTSDATDAQGGLYLLQCESGDAHCTVDIPGDDAVVANNVLYRIHGNHIAMFAANAGEVDRARVERNLIFGGCTTAAAECAAIETQECLDCVIANNVVYDFMVGDATTITIGIDAKGAASDHSTGQLVKNNWVVNVVGTGIVGTTETYLVHNYVSHVTIVGLNEGHWYSNVVRELGLDDTGVGALGLNPTSAYGNYFYGNSAGAIASTDCNATGCTRFGIRLRGTAGASAEVIIIDQIISAIGDANSSAGHIHISANDPDYDITVSHLTCANAVGTNEFGIRIEADTDTHDPVLAWDFIDTIVQDIDNNGFGSCAGGYTGSTTMVDTFTNVYGRESWLSADRAGAIAAACDDDAETVIGYYVVFNGVLYEDFSISDGNAMSTAGTAPAGSAVGSRVFAFNKADLADTWGGSLPWATPFPVNFANGDASMADTDGDGILDLHDNCDYTVNSVQTDADSDGKGCACDSDEAC